MTSQASSKFQLIDFYQMGGNMPEEVHGGHGSILLNLWAARRTGTIFGHNFGAWLDTPNFECMALNFWSLFMYVIWGWLWLRNGVPVDGASNGPTHLMNLSLQTAQTRPFEQFGVNAML